MKPVSTVLFLLLIHFTCLVGQEPIIISADSLSFGQTIMPAVSVTIPEADYEKSLKEWVKLLQARTKSKVVTENNKMSIFGANIKDLSEDPINVFSTLGKNDSALILCSSFELKKDVFIGKSNYESLFMKAQNFLKEFAKNQYVDVVKDQADAEEDKLRDLQKELSSLENEKSRMQKSIQSNKRTISDENGNIETQNNELNVVTAALTEQNILLSTMEPGPAQKEKQDQISELEKRKKKAENSIESSQRKIRKAESEIDKDTDDIPKNERMQNKVKDLISAQEEVYQRFATKLKTVRSY
jgi:predicted  nucleic acid-binding Zn-ribbon protein